LLLAATEEVLGKYNYHILALFSDGALVEGVANPDLDLTKEIAIAWQEKIDSVFGGNIEKLIKATKDGIKISPQAVKHDRTEVLDTVITLLEKKKNGFKPNDVQVSIKKYGQEKIDNPELLKTAIDTGLIPVDTDEDFKISEGMKAAYLSYRKANVSTSEVWDKICTHMGLSIAQRLALEPFDPQYGRCLFAAKAATNGIAGIIAAIDESLNFRQNIRVETDDEETEEAEVSEERIEAVRRGISCPFVKPINKTQELRNYINAKPKERSSLGATINKAQELNAPEMPVGTQVQKFSNRLLGGNTSEPKRSGEPTASLAYQLMTVGGYLPNKCKEPPYYVHFKLPEGSSPTLLGIWRDWLKEMTNIDGGGTPVTVDELKLYRDKQLAFKPNKVVGLALPKRSDFVYSTVPIPITWGDTNTSIALLKSLRLTLELALAPEFGFPFILTAGLQIDSSTQAFGRVEGIPSNLQTLLSVKNGKVGIYDRAEAEEILIRLRCLSDLAIDTVSLSKVDDCIYDLARGCAQPLSLYFILLRWILREKDDPNFSSIWQKIKQPLQILLESLMTENKTLTDYLKQAAKIAAESKLRGSSFKRTSLVEPFSEFIAAIRAQKSYMDLDFMFAALAQKYHTRLDRIREHGVGATKLEKIKDFYAVLRQMYADIYHSRADKILNDRSNLEAAYLFFLQEEIDLVREKEKQEKENKKSDSTDIKD
jgi:CRISPR-associated protein Csc3